MAAAASYVLRIPEDAATCCSKGTASAVPEDATPAAAASYVLRIPEDATPAVSSDVLYVPEDAPSSALYVPEDATPAWRSLPPTGLHTIPRTDARRCIPFPLRVFRHGVGFDEKTKHANKERCLKKLRAAELPALFTARQRLEIEFFLTHATYENCAIRHIHGGTTRSQNNWLLQLAAAATEHTTDYQNVTNEKGNPQLTFAVVYDDCVHAASIRPGTVYCVFYTTGV
jgi:hypothetical protein